MHIYIEHKFEVDKGLGDIVEPRNIGVSETIGLETVEPETGARTRSGVTSEIDVVPETRIGSKTEFKPKIKVGPITSTKTEPVAL